MVTAYGIRVLSENTSVSEDLGSEHGLSLYIETKEHKILFDTGQAACFRKREKNGDRSFEVDLVFLSHGHYDHGGGLKTFSGQRQGEVYLRRQAFEPHYADRGGRGKGL
jgi:7,8-dihydropterin-6-yl-methyl-4-(beta-D-ribofuranosyl)aminobenzene 5'-phosphate synthase